MVQQFSISDDLKRVFKYAREEAMRSGSCAIEPTHLFLAILRDLPNPARKVLYTCGVDLEGMKSHIDHYTLAEDALPFDQIDQISFSRRAQDTLGIMAMEAARLKSQVANSCHLLLALCHGRHENLGQQYLAKQGIHYGELVGWMQELDMLRPGDTAAQQGDAPQSPEQGDGRAQGGERPEDPEAEQRKLDIEAYTFDLTRAAQQGKLDPVVGRDAEISRVIEILGRRKKNNPMLIGEPGVGKSAIVEGIALKIASGTISQALSGKRILSLDIASVVAGTKYRGDFEKRLKNIIKEATENPDVILFIDEFHTIVGAGGASGSLDAANMLKPALARGEFQCIGATTLEEFRKVVEKDGALDRRFQKVSVEPTDTAQSVKILQQLRPGYEKFHSVTYTDDALLAAVRLTDRYIQDKFLPDKAIDAMDEAGSMVRLSTRRKGKAAGTVTEEDIAQVVAKMTGIPVFRVAESEGNRLLKMDKHLKGRIIGQDEAIDTVVRAIRRNRAGLKDPVRPIGTFLFFGPTGVGKTQLARSLAEYLFDGGDNLVRIDMSEYMEKFSVSRLIGAPPGYVGYEDGGQLSEKVRRKPYCVVLLDEIEKAHPDVFNLLLQVMDEGRLTDSNGRTVSFKNTLLIMTSNVGSRELSEYGNGIGFATPGKDLSQNRQAILEKSVQKAFPPEFINRVDARIFFNALDYEAIERIIDIELRSLRERALEAGYKVTVTPSAKRLVAAHGYDPAYGARPLKRALMNLVEDPVSEFILSERARAPKGAPDKEHPTTLRVTLSQGRQGTVVERKTEKTTTYPEKVHP